MHAEQKDLSLIGRLLGSGWTLMGLIIAAAYLTGCMNYRVCASGEEISSYERKETMSATSLYCKWFNCEKEAK